MSGLKEMWAKIDALAAKEKAKWPHWFVGTGGPLEWRALIQAPTKEAAEDIYRNRTTVVHPDDMPEKLAVTLATPEAIAAWRREFSTIPQPTVEELKATGFRPGIDHDSTLLGVK